MNNTTLEIAALRRCLESVPVGEVCTWTAMSEAIGRPVQDRRWVLVRAIRQVESETPARFESVYKVGYRRLTAAEFHQPGVHARKRIRATARTGIARLSGPRPNLSRDVEHRIAGEQAVLNALIELVAERVVEKVTEKAQGATLPVGNVLRLFKD